MAKSFMGAKVVYCGHNGWFTADIFEVAGANVVHAPVPLDLSKLVRGRADEATHHLSDFPSAGVWKPNHGFFVVPSEQVKELELGKQLLEHFARAAAAAVDGLHQKGISAHGEVDGVWQEIPVEIKTR